MPHSYSVGDRVEVDFTNSSQILKNEFNIPTDGQAQVDITEASVEKTYPSGATDPLYDGDAVNFPVSIENFSEKFIIGLV